MGMMFRNMLIAFGPEVNFATISGIIMISPNNAVLIIIRLSFDIPADMSFNVDALSVAANPI